MWIALAALATVGAQMVPQNAHCVVYTDSCGQLLDTLPVCQDFNRQVCNRPACKFIHLSDGNVEVIDNRVTVCRDAVKGACMRPQCKYYHIPVALPPAPLMAIASHACGPNFLENISWTDCSLDRICSGESLSEFNFTYANTYKYVAMLERHFTVQERLTPTFPTNDTI
ncbi:Muscleblind-like protein 2 [Trachymyrmex cornetzi]|uniref:Muscleblind-like protein 2 n=1 Tax=Trachymyrmex cornetzi TaxID=471704 RepID=A0A195DM33_9HYME|nr:Muscleblind-like protein 2 [Trachymyrmex cornetzi]